MHEISRFLKIFSTQKFERPRTALINSFLFLEACRDGWFGNNCSLQCTGHCRDGTVCNHVTGQCDRGCEAGWKGSFCEKVTIVHTALLLRLNIIVSIKSINKLLLGYILFLQTLIKKKQRYS